MQNWFGEKPPTIKEMWKNEPNKFRQWIILFGVSLMTFIIISISSIILIITDRDSLIDLFEKLDPLIKDKQSANLLVWNTMIIIPIIITLFATASLGTYLFTLYKSYKIESFSKISILSVYFSKIIGFFAFLNIFWVYKSLSLFSKNPGAILYAASTVMSLILFFLALKISKIRKMFIFSEKMEQLQSTPEYQQTQEQMRNFFFQSQNGGPMHSPFGTPTKPTKTTKNNNVKKNTKIKESKENIQLKKLKLDELRNIAKKLSISGSEKMNKDELITYIIRITNKD